MIKFLHAADFHLDAPFSTLSEAAARQRRQEQRQAVRDLCALCDREGCDLMLLSGDLFDSDNAFPDTIECLLSSFAACRARIFISPGNHDYFTSDSAYETAEWPENVHIFKKSSVEAVELPELRCAVYGAAFSSMDSAALLEDFSVRDPELCNLMVLHGELKPGSCYNPITETQIAASGLDYLALGHVHQHGGLCRAGKTAYAWPGCLMGRGFDELGEKGCLVGRVGKGFCAAEFVPIPGRRYEILRVRAGNDPLAAIRAAMPADTAQHIYRVYLDGESETPDTRALYRALAGDFFGLTVLDCTTPPVDLWQGCGEETLRGQFLQELKARYDSATSDGTRRATARAARLGLAAMEGREVPEL
ncbi:MAG: metallophosphoesterase [Oscillospiraceae bacterium]|nr:metallophosphoesterase [Oscillospiraceae bacterium]